MSASPPILPPKSTNLLPTSPTQPSSSHHERTVPSPNRRTSHPTIQPQSPPSQEDNGRPFPFNHSHKSLTTGHSRTFSLGKAPDIAELMRAASLGTESGASQASPEPLAIPPHPNPSLSPVGSSPIDGVEGSERGRSDGVERGARRLGARNLGIRGRGKDNSRRPSGTDVGSPRGLESPLSSESDTTNSPFNRMSRANSGTSQLSAESRESDVSDLSRASSMDDELDAFVTPNEVFQTRRDPFDEVGNGNERDGMTEMTPMHEKGDPMAVLSESRKASVEEINAAAGEGPSTQAARIARETALATGRETTDSLEPAYQARYGDGQELEEDEEDEDDEEELLEGDEMPDFADRPATHPILTRSFSAPLPNRVGHLRHPRSVRGPSRLRHASAGLEDAASRLSLVQSDSAQSLPGNLPSPSALETVSIELADSLQSAIQTLLHLSPPHLLDNAKEQYSACTVQLPTTSLSAILTAMRGLNYLSANLHALCQDELADTSPHIPPHAASGDKQSREETPATTNETPPSFSGTQSAFPLRRIPGVLNHGDISEDFDVGEMVQSTADLLGAQAAHAGVDLAIFHGDVGIKHVSVNGDGEGLGYALSHVIRQILLVCRKGDALELGLQVAPQSPSLTPKLHHLLTTAEIEDSRKHPQHPFSEEGSGAISPGEAQQLDTSSLNRGPLLLTFQIVHNALGDKGEPRRSSLVTPRAEKAEPVMLPPRTSPDFNGLLCKRILRHVNATLRIVDNDSVPFLGSPAGVTRQAYELSILLARGDPIIEPPILSTEEQAARQPYPSVQLAREPTLKELAQFAERLRGKPVELHANARSVFARHITSYLAAWGMDVSHIPTDASINPVKPARYGSALSASRSNDEIPSQRRHHGDNGATDRFVIIDDDIEALRGQLLRTRSEVPVLHLRPKNLKRPSMSARTRSSPQIRAIQESAAVQASASPIKPNTLIHFTSLSNYNHVRDVVANILATTPPTSYPPPPDVLIIPKPIGPRRFLTTLHTAINRPLIDPYFAPIANSPRSPGGGYFPGMIPRTPNGLDGLQRRNSYLGGSTGSPPPADIGGYLDAGQGTDAYASPALSHTSNVSGGSRQLKTPAGDVLATPAAEYFNDAAAKLGGSAATGVMVASPDGRPYGMYFEPPIRDNSRRIAAARSEPRRRAATRTKALSAGDGRLAPSNLGASPTQRRLSSMSAVTAGDPERKSALNPVLDEEESAESSSNLTPTPILRGGSLRRKNTSGQVSTSASQRRERAAAVSEASRSNSATPHQSPPHGAEEIITSSPLLERSPLMDGQGSKKAMAIEARRRVQAKAAEAAALSEIQKAKAAPAATKKGAAPAKGGLIAPPINVLIVEDNPINQNILSMFLRKKKIKHQAANNGQEAVDKWRTGTFHLILMDIQLPVMDGIEATKEIRRMEKDSNIGIFPSTPNQEVTRTLSPALDDSAVKDFRSSVIIVALTASSYQTDRVNALAAGCNDFLTKPVSLPWLEAKIVEWGCMQALIDFEGWRKWRTSDNKDSKSVAESKKNFLANSEAKAKLVAKGLTINRGNRMIRAPPSEGPPTPPVPTPDESGGPLGLAISVTQPTPREVDAQSDPVHSTLPAVPEASVVAGDKGVSGLEVLKDGLKVAKAEEDQSGGREQAPAIPTGEALDKTIPAPTAGDHSPSSEVTPVATDISPAPPTATDRAKSTDDQPISPDIEGAEGDPDSGAQPSSEDSPNPWGEHTSRHDTGVKASREGLAQEYNPNVPAPPKPSEARRFSSADKPLPPLPESKD